MISRMISRLITTRSRNSVVISRWLRWGPVGSWPMMAHVCIPFEAMAWLEMEDPSVHGQSKTEKKPWDFLPKLFEKF